MRLRDDPIFDCPDNTFYYEDPDVWYNNKTQSFQLIVKDFHGHITHHGYSGAHAVSKDGINWNFTNPALAYLPENLWDDGVIRKQKRQERPQVLRNENGDITHIYFATDTGLKGEPLFWNIVWPLK